MIRRFPRALCAASAIGVWLIGFELGPALHVGLHDLWGDHTHGAHAHRGAGHAADAHGHEAARGFGHGLDEGARWRARWATRHAARAERLPKVAARVAARWTSPAGDHGQGSLAHRDVAAEPARDALPPVGPPRPAGALARPAPPGLYVAAPPARPRARAPPSLG